VNIHKQNTTPKANNVIYSTTKLSWFRHLLRHSARKRGGIIQWSWAHVLQTLNK